MIVPSIKVPRNPTHVERKTERVRSAQPAKKETTLLGLGKTFIILKERLLCRNYISSVVGKSNSSSIVKK
jgi:hypothetical protein